MRTIYIDSDYKCHLESDGTMNAVEAVFFDGCSKAFIEGYIFVPSGATWTREDGEVFEGEMIVPWKDSKTLELAQSAYEESLAELQDMQAALELLNVTPSEEVNE